MKSNNRFLSNGYIRWIFTILMIVAFGVFLLEAILYLRYENNKQYHERFNNDFIKGLNSDIFISSEKAISAVTKSLTLQQMLFDIQNNPEDGKQTDREMMLNIIRNSSGSDIIYLMDLNGNCVASSYINDDTKETLKGNNFAYRDYFKKAVKGVNNYYFARGAVTDIMGIFYAFPIYGNNREIIGVGSIKKNLNSSEFLMNSNENYFIVDQNGVIISANKGDYLFKTLTPIDKTLTDKIIESQQYGILDGILSIEAQINEQTMIINGVKYHYLRTDLFNDELSIYTFRDYSEVFMLNSWQIYSLYIISLLFTLFLVSGNVIFSLKRDKKKIKNEILILSRAIDQSKNIVVITDPKGIIQYVNDMFTAITGYSKEEILGKNTNILTKKNMLPKEHYLDLWMTISSGNVWEGEFCNLKKNGEEYWETGKITPVIINGEISNYIAIKEDSTEKRIITNQMKYYATNDEMTRTYNRNTCFEQLGIVMEKSKQEGQQFVIAFVDINGLKQINDRFGHKEGDNLIITIVETMRNKLRSSDMICRIGGDEFLIIMPYCQMMDAQMVWDKIIGRVNILNEGSTPYLFSFSYGLVEYLPFLPQTIDQLMNEADLRMYENKKILKEKLGPKGVIK